jgi:catechol 2,3-dioxygenase-like lactoylglutathione lyase family enzyme
MAGESIVLEQFNLVVRDMAASVAFYRRLGLDVRDTEPQWERHHRNVVLPGGIHLDLDSVAFAKHWDRGWPTSGGGGMGVLGFRVGSRDAVDRLYADLTGAGYRGQQEPYDAFWGVRYAVVEDPDGNAVGLMSEADAAMRSAGPDFSSLA